MKCIYKEFMRRKRDDWSVEFSENMRIRFIESGIMLTSAETRVFREMISAHEDRDNSQKKDSQEFPFIRKSCESSDYSTSEEFRKLFEETEETTTTDEEDIGCAESPYKPLPDVLRDLKKWNYKKLKSSSKRHNDEEFSSSQQYADRAERYRVLREEDALAEMKEIVVDPQGICQSYRPHRYQVRNKERRGKRNSAPGTSGKNTDRCYEYSDQTPLRTLRAPCESKLDVERDCLLKNEMHFDTVICCVLCRLLISKSTFMRPCKCSDVFVHTECALSYEKELTRQKCFNCKQIYRAGIFQTDLDKLDSQLKKGDVSKKKCRLPIEYEKDCFICLDSRKVRKDAYENLDSTIVRACRCNVTAHNECLVKLLLSERRCEYCKKRFRMKTHGPNIGYFDRNICLKYGCQLALVIFLGIILILLTSQYVEVTNTVLNMIVKNLCISFSLVASTYLVISILRVWKEKSREISKKSAVVIKSYESLVRAVNPMTAKREQRQPNYEEIPFKQIEKLF